MCLSSSSSPAPQGESYTLSKAQHAYKSLVKIHEKSGECVRGVGGEGVM